MAADLRKISNKNYNAYGNGRDWFFLGSSDYRNGARTPLPNDKCQEQQKPPSKKKGAPTEVVCQRARLNSTKKRVTERWQNHHDNVPSTCNTQNTQNQKALARTTGSQGERWRGSHAPNSSQFATTYNQLGQHPGWTGERYELPAAKMNRTLGIMGSASEPSLKEPLKLMEGDHSLGVRSKLPHHVTTYSEHARYQEVDHDRYQTLQHRPPTMSRHASEPILKEMEGDHTQGIRARDYTGFSTHMGDLGSHQPLPKAVGQQRKQSALCEELRDAGVHGYKAHERPPRQMEGDYTLGIQPSTPHMFSTSWDLGRFQKIDSSHQRYESKCPPVASTPWVPSAPP